MLIRRMTATFGKLREQTLELQDGLNILQAPNETGKSTWCAFLLSMLYGVNTKERGALADKNRYAPWSGGAMSGRLDCRVGDDALSLYRATRRPSAPMGEFQALYAGTAEPVPGLTGANCGEVLLGVSREVYARSAFIRQGGVAVTQDPGLERRVAALITSGEEDTSYTEASEALKKQLNRRRHNKTGQIPALEAELRETEAQLASQAELVRQREGLLLRAADLEAREASIKEELAALDRWEAQRKRLELQRVEDAAVQAEVRAAALRRRVEEERIPENDVTGRLRGAIVNLNTVRKSAEKAQEKYEAAQAARVQAEEKLSASSFAGKTPEEARALPLDLPPKPRLPWWVPVLAVLLGLALGGAVYALRREVLPAVGGGCGLAGCLLLLAGLVTARRQSKWEARAAEARAEREAALASFSALYQAAQEAKQEASAKAAAAQGLWQSVDVNADGILEEVRRFAPSAYDIPSADAALRACALLRKELSEADRAAREARLRAEFQARQAPDPADPDAPFLLPPQRSREEAAEDLESVQTDLAALRSSLDRIAGRLHAAGDPLALQARAEELTDGIAALEGEYAAIELAMDALAQANTQLQGRFSPALGRRAAQIFGQLTGGAYGGVVLDRALHVSAEPAGSGVPRDVDLLSAGAADQLYLAVRLAVCDLVLPPENAAPIVLDDALSNFDDARCAAALDYLHKEAEKRQILLFTCHSREAAYFRDDPAVAIQVLTAPGERV